MELLARLSQYKISRRDKKLLIIAAGLLLLFSSYRFIYYPNNQRAQVIEKKIDKLTVREKALQHKNNRVQEIKDDNASLEAKINTLTSHYGTGASYQKTILFLEGLKQATGMEISVIGFPDPDTSLDTKPEDSEQVGEATDSDSTALVKNSDEATDSEVANEDVPAISGYDSVVSIDFKVNYDGLKKGIDYIDHYPERMSIKELNIGYDMQTGNLSGTMQINMYQLKDTGKIDAEPAIAGVSTGNANIFGTIEVSGEW